MAESYLFSFFFRLHVCDFEWSSRKSERIIFFSLAAGRPSCTFFFKKKSNFLDSEHSTQVDEVVFILLFLIFFTIFAPALCLDSFIFLVCSYEKKPLFSHKRKKL